MCEIKATQDLNYTEFFAFVKERLILLSNLWVEISLTEKKFI